MTLSRDEPSAVQLDCRVVLGQTVTVRFGIAASARATSTASSSAVPMPEPRTPGGRRAVELGVPGSEGERIVAAGVKHDERIADAPGPDVLLGAGAPGLRRSTAHRCGRARPKQIVGLGQRDGGQCTMWSCSDRNAGFSAGMSAADPGLISYAADMGARVATSDRSTSRVSLRRRTGASDRSHRPGSCRVGGRSW